MKPNIGKYFLAAFLCYLVIQISGLVTGAAYIHFAGGVSSSLTFNFLYECLSTGFLLTVIPTALYSIILTLIATILGKGKQSLWKLLTISCALTIIIFGIVLGAMSFMFGGNACGFQADNIIFLAPSLLSGLLGTIVINWCLKRQ